MTAREFLQEVDGLINLVKKHNPNFVSCCKAGCDHCCYEPAYASHLEVKDMLAALTKENRDYVATQALAWLEKTQEVVSREIMPKVPVWRPLQAACPFLKDRQCLAYKQRPSGCRVYFARENPDNCAWPARQHQKFIEFSPNLINPTLDRFFMEADDMIADHIGALVLEQLLGIKSGSASRQSTAALKEAYVLCEMQHAH